jgi:hypothetical protein
MQYLRQRHPLHSALPAAKLETGCQTPHKAGSEFAKLNKNKPTSGFACRISVVGCTLFEN